MDFAKIYPYVVPAGRLKEQADLPDGLIVPVGHDVVALPVQDMGANCHFILPQELHDVDIDTTEAHLLALANLETLAKGPAIQKAIHQVPNGFQVMIWSGHWLAASCLRLPGLFKFASQILETDRLCVSIPQRELLFVFPFGTREQRDEMRNIIRDNEDAMAELITWELFALSADGLQACVET